MALFFFIPQYEKKEGDIKPLFTFTKDYRQTSQSNNNKKNQTEKKQLKRRDKKKIV